MFNLAILVSLALSAAVRAQGFDADFEGAVAATPAACRDSCTNTLKMYSLCTVS